MNDNQVKYIEKILEANLATLREELRGLRTEIQLDRLASNTKIDEVITKVNGHDTRLDGLEKLWNGLFGRLAFVAALGGMVMAVFYEWIKKQFSFLP